MLDMFCSWCGVTYPAVQIEVPPFLQELAASAPGPAEIVSVASGRFTDLRLDLSRPDDNDPSAWILVSAGHEVFFLDLAGGYQTGTSAYTLEDKREALRDLFDVACLFLNGRFTEHLWERNGQVISSELRFTDSPSAFLTSGGVKGRIIRRFGRQIKYHQRTGPHDSTT
jgi:hypothetical protein